MTDLRQMAQELATLKQAQVSLPQRLLEAARRAMTDQKAQADFVRIQAEREALAVKTAELDARLQAEVAKAEAEAKAQQLRDAERDYRRAAETLTRVLEQWEEIGLKVQRAEAGLNGARDQRDAPRIERARKELMTALEARKAFEPTFRAANMAMMSVTNRAQDLGMKDPVKAWGNV